MHKLPPLSAESKEKVDKLFKKILDLGIDQSLRDLLSSQPGDIEEVACDNPGILVDIDTPEEYEKQLKNLK